MSALQTFLEVARVFAAVEPAVAEIFTLLRDAFASKGNTIMAQRIEAILPATSQSEALAKKLEGEL